MMKHKRGYYDVFVRTCAAFPTNIAVHSYKDDHYKTYTYSELYGVCEYIAQNLQQVNSSKGAGIIGIISERNIITPCVIAAAHKCSTTFMFLDPLQDLEAVMNKVKLKTIISVDHSRGNLINRAPDKTITVFDIPVRIYDMGVSRQNSKVPFIHSFISSTSGSTGEPKHIQVPVTCLQPNIQDLTKLFNITSKDIIYFSTPLTFDPSMIEIMLACTNGASLLIAPEKIEVLFPKNTANSITFWQTTPSKFFQHSNADIAGKILCCNSTLKYLALGGEPLTSIQRLKGLKAPDNTTKIFSLYGVTEMSCWACAVELDLKQMDDNAEVPLGNCLSETVLKVQELSNNEYKGIGKILLSSQSRRCMVLNSSSKDSEVRKDENFLDTGDLGEIRNGTVYYRGRTDDVIKRFGNKINLQIIEATIKLCPRVRTCSCVWLPKLSLLVVYFSSESFSSQELTNFVKCKLDEKHWPDKIIRVANLPMNKHGKISRQLISKLYEADMKASISQIQLSQREILLTEICASVQNKLSYDDIKDKDFFSIGGSSFIALTLCNKLSQHHPQFASTILPHLLSQNKTIDEILQIASDQSLTKTVKRARSATAETESVSNKRSVSESLFNKKSVCASVSMCMSKSPVEFIVLWKYNTEKCVDASPTLLESRLSTYVTVGSHSGKILTFDAVTQKKLVVSVDTRIEAPVYCFEVRPCEPVGVVGCYDGTVLCFTLHTAELRWRTSVGAMVKSKAAACAGLVYVAAYDGNLHCIDALTGEIKKRVLIATQPISADLVVAKQAFILVATLSGALAGVAARERGGSVAWRGAVAGPVFARPALYERDKYVVFAEVGGELHCRTVEKGIKIWRYQGAKGNIFSSLYVKELNKWNWQMVFGCHDSKAYSIIVQKCLPSLHWVTQLQSPIYSTPCALTDLLILAVANQGCLNVINSETGEVIAEYSLPKESFSSPVVHGNTIFIGCRDDNVYSIQYSMTC